MTTTSEIKLTAELDLNEEQICDIIAKALEVDREDVKLSKVVKEKGGKSSVDIFVNVKKEFTVKTKEKEYIPIVGSATEWPRPSWWVPYGPTITRLDVPYTPTITTSGTDVHTVTNGGGKFNSTTGTVTLEAFNNRSAE